MITSTFCSAARKISPTIGAQPPETTLRSVRGVALRPAAGPVRRATRTARIAAADHHRQRRAEEGAGDAEAAEDQHEAEDSRPIAS